MLERKTGGDVSTVTPDLDLSELETGSTVVEQSRRSTTKPITIPDAAIGHRKIWCEIADMICQSK